MIYASGNVEIPYNYVDIGSINVVIGKQRYELLLPYEKPEGITKIPTKDTTGIIIHELIIDGKKANPERIYFSANEAIDRLYEETTQAETEYRVLKILWYTATVRPDEEIIKKQGLFYKTVIGNGKKIRPEQYKIPYGTQEVFLRYSIWYPLDVRNNNTSNINLDQEYVVRWTMEWPEIPPEWSNVPAKNEADVFMTEEFQNQFEAILNDINSGNITEEEAKEKLQVLFLEVSKK